MLPFKQLCTLNIGQGMEEEDLRALLHCWVSVKWCTHFGKYLDDFS